MLQNLKKCKTMEELLLVLGKERISIIIMIGLTLLICVPVIMIGEYIKYYWQLEDRWLIYQCIQNEFKSTIFSLGLVCFIGFLVLLLYFWIISCEKKCALVAQALKKNPWIICLLGMFFWSIFSTICSEDITLCIFGSDYRAEGLFTYLLYVGIFGCALFLQEEKLQRALFIIFSAVGNIMSILMLAQVCGGETITHIFRNVRSAVFFNPNHLGYFLNLSIFVLFGLFFYEKSKLLRWYLVISMTFQVFALVINNTFGCYLAMCVAIVILTFFVTRKNGRFLIWYWIPIGIIVILSVLSCVGVFDAIAVDTVGNNILRFLKDILRVAKSPTNATGAGTHRIELWMESFRLIPQHPIVGFGPDAFLSELMMEKGAGRPHNEYLQYTLYLGLPGIICYLSALILIFAKCCKQIKQISSMQMIAGGCVLTYLISACFGNTMFYTTPYFWMFLGLLL